MTIKQKLTKIAAAGMAVVMSAAGASAQLTSTHTFYNLSTTTVADGTVSTRWGGNAEALGRPLRPDGSTVTVGSTGTSKELRVTNRVNDGEPVNWGGLDILLEQMMVNNNFVDGTYSVTVAGNIPAGVTIPPDAHVSMNRIDTWSEVAVSQAVTSSNRNFELKWEPFAMSANTFRDFVTTEDRANRALRIQTRNAPGMNFTITSLVIKVEPPEGDIYEWPTPAWNNTIASMKDKFKDVFQIGTIMSPGTSLNRLHDSYQSAAFFLKHYNVVTLENHMKPDAMMPSAGTTRFAAADSVVNWANQNNIDVIGHTLVWHSQSPDWVNGGQMKQPLTRTQARQNMQTYINTVAGHYKGKVVAWDVVNEAFMNIGECFELKNDWRDALRSSPCHRESLNLNVNDHTNNQLSPWYDAYANGATGSQSGADYIYDAFVFTRLADPGAKLYYNDFNEEFWGKRESIAQMVEQLNEQWKTDERNTEPDRMLIEAIGMQSHYYGGGVQPVESMTYNLARVDSTIQRFAATGARISITELDIPMGGWSSADRYNKIKLSDAEDQLLGKLYADLMRTYLKYANHIDRITFWGMSDGVSWRNYGMPLLFDNSLRPKAAFDSIMAIDIGLYTSIKTPNRAAQNVKKPNMKVTTGRSAINVKFNAVNSGEAVLRLFNVKGEVISTAKFNTVAGRSYSHAFRQKKLPNGFYVVRMQNGSLVEQSRVVIAK